MKSIVFVFLTLLLLSACGKKGALLPPEALVPASVGNLNVMQSGQEFRITWSAPSKEQGGRPLKDLAGFQLLRRAVTPEGGECPSCPGSWRLLTGIDLDRPTSFSKSGELFIYLDKGGNEIDQVQYRITALSKSGGTSRPADAPLKKLFRTPPPPTIKATLQQSSIRIDCTPAPAARLLAIGCNIYRRTTGSAPPLLPFNQEPVTGTVWEDQSLEYGRNYHYSAASVVKIEGEIVESSRSEEIEIVFRQQELR